MRLGNANMFKRKNGIASRWICLMLAVVLLLPQMPAAVRADDGADAEWWNFRNSEVNNAVTDRPTPTSDTEAWEKWAVKFEKSPTPPVIVNGKLYVGSENHLYELSKETGEVLRVSEELPAEDEFAMQSPVYADGKIFISIKQGRICAVRLSDLSLAWTTDNTDITGGQTVSPISYAKINGTGYVYTGTTTLSSKGGDLICATTDDSNVTNGIKQLTWHFDPSKSDTDNLKKEDCVALGYYWTGAYVCENYLAIGADNGSANGSGDAKTPFYTLNPVTGEVIDAVYGIQGAVRSTVVYQNGALYFSTKNARLYKISVDKDGRMGAVSSIALKDIADVSSSTATPVVYGGRIYLGLQGNGGQFNADGGHKFAVVRDDEQLTDASYLYSLRIPGFPQAGALLSNYHETEDFDGDGSADGRVYLFFTYNAFPGGIFYTYDTPGRTAPAELSVEESRIFVPGSGKQQHCISSVVVDRDGTLYYKNDSNYLFAVESNPAALEVMRLFDTEGNELTPDQAFQTKRAEYSVTVPSVVTELDIRLEMTADASAEIAGTPYTEGMLTPLQEGVTEIPIVVSKSGKSRTYTLTVTKASGNADLKLLASTKGNTAPNLSGSYVRELMPAFDKEVTDYQIDWITTETGGADDPAYGSNARMMNLFLTPDSDKVTKENIKVWPGENCKQVSSAVNADGTVICANGNAVYKYRYPVYSADITKDSTARIEVTAEDGTVKTYHVTFVRRVKVAGIEMNPASLTLQPEEEGQLSVSFNPEKATDQGLTWSCSDETVAKVEAGEGGTAAITALSPGKVVVKALSNELDGQQTAYAVVTVSDPEDPEHAHEWDAGVIDPEPTCAEDGTITFTCLADPSHVITDTIPATGHTLVHHDALAASCTEDGQNEFWECATCGVLFADETGTIEIADAAGLISPATGHAFGDWEQQDEQLHRRICSHDPSHVETEEHLWDSGAVTREPAPGQAGESVFTCTVCGAKKTETIAPLPEVVPADQTAPAVSDPDINAVTPSEKTANAAKTDASLQKIAGSGIAIEAKTAKKTMTVTWSKVQNAVNYRVEYRKAGAAKWTAAWSGGKNSYTVKKCKSGGLYEVRITPFGKSGGSWVRGTVSDVRDCWFRAAPKASFKAAKKKITVSWKKDKKATGYQILYATKKDMSNAKVVNVSKKKTQYTLKKLKSRKNYYIRVRAVRKSGGRKYEGILSVRKKVKTK